jgi:hypothetical protein
MRTVYQLSDGLYPLCTVKPVMSLESSCKRGDCRIDRAATVRKAELVYWPLLMTKVLMII